MKKLPIMSNFDLDKILGKYPGYLGTVSKDELSRINIHKNKPSFGIINMNNSDQPGSHWIAYFNDPTDTKHIFYFDSYGIQPPQETIKFLKKTGKDILYNTTEIQSVKSVSCGWFCCCFIMSCLKKVPYLNFVNHFSNDGDKRGDNEKKLVKLLKQNNII